MKILTDKIALVANCARCDNEIELSPNAAAYSGRGILCKACMRRPPDPPHFEPEIPEKWTKQLYADYLQTEHWRVKRGEALDRAGHRCQVCASTARLETHHNCYDNLGGEPLVDLVVLCSVCHSLFHGVV